MNIGLAYQKLFDVPGYSFIFDQNGQIHEWGSDEIKSRGFHGPDVSGVRLHLVPGSFNPLHESHCEIYQNAVNQQLDLKFMEDADESGTFFEMSVERVDKAMVTLPQLEQRLQQFVGLAPVVISRAPRFVEKIGVYLSHVRGITFHVGIDCITRMKDDYGLWGIQGLAAKFIVYDRIMNGRHMSLMSEFEESIPRNCISADIIRSPESLSRSSTQIRNKLSQKR